jgi:peptidoglycan hydrolase CwlO-like protein
VSVLTAEWLRALQMQELEESNGRLEDANTFLEARAFRLQEELQQLQQQWEEGEKQRREAAALSAQLSEQEQQLRAQVRAPASTVCGHGPCQSTAAEGSAGSAPAASTWHV